LENFCVRGFSASPQLYPVGPDWFNYRLNKSVCLMYHVIEAYTVCVGKATRISYLVARWKMEFSKSRLVKIKRQAFRPILPAKSNVTLYT
jgi:hypothetical protein